VKSSIRRLEHAPDGTDDTEAETELTVENPLLELLTLELRVLANEDEIEPDDAEIGGGMLEDDSDDEAPADDALDEEDKTAADDPLDGKEDDPLDGKEEDPIAEEEEAFEDEIAVEKEEALEDDTMMEEETLALEEDTAIEEDEPVHPDPGAN
jgi:hypothetical protein